MKQINLLPVSVRAKAARQKTLPLLVVAVLAATAGVGMLYVIMGREVAQAERQLAQRTAEREAAAAEVAATHAALALPASTQDRLNKVNALVPVEVDWARALELVGAILPKDVRLSSYSYAVVEGVYTLSLTGTAPSNVSFAVLVESVQKSTLVSNAQVTGYTYDPTANSVTFSMQMTVPQEQVTFQQP